MRNLIYLVFQVSVDGCIYVLSADFIGSNMKLFLEEKSHAKAELFV